MTLTALHVFEHLPLRRRLAPIWALAWQLAKEKCSASRKTLSNLQQPLVDRYQTKNQSGNLHWAWHCVSDDTCSAHPVLVMSSPFVSQLSPSWIGVQLPQVSLSLHCVPMQEATDAKVAVGATTATSRLATNATLRRRRSSFVFDTSGLIVTACSDVHDNCLCFVPSFRRKPMVTLHETTYTQDARADSSIQICQQAS
jgi:hypothetical protein